MTTSGNELYNERQRMATSDNEWQRVIQRVTTSDTTSGNEWERITTSGTINENKRKRIRASKREWFWFHNETIYAMHNHNMFSNIGYLWIRKFLINLLAKQTEW